MQPIEKLLIGGAVVSLLAWGSHALTGDSYVHSLNDKAETALSDAGIDGVASGMRTDGGLSRTVVLSGDVPPETRARAEAALEEVSGIGTVLWASDITGEYSTELPARMADDGANGDGDGSSGGGASDPAVASCQSGIDEAMTDKTINFRSGSAYMPNSSVATVSAVAEVLIQCEELKVLVGGHTDAAGADGVNQRMSQARADAVAAVLIEKGVTEARITATGFGETQLKVPGDGANEANRRIEFTVSNADAQTGAAEEN